MDEYTIMSGPGRPPITAGDEFFAREHAESFNADYAFVKLLLRTLSRDFAAGRLIVIPGLNGIKADDIVGALDMIYAALARLCIESQA